VTVLFPFPLETLLRHRRHLEEVLQRDLAVFNRSVEEEKQRLRDREKGREDLERDFARGGNFSAGDLLLFERSFRRQEERLREQRRRLDEAEALAAKKRDHLLEAVKRRRMLDRLKEKHRTAHRRSEIHRERDFMNEIAVNRFNRGLGPGALE
jgi:flagellar FliJ protein